MRTFSIFKVIIFAVFVFTVTFINAQTTYTLITDVNELESGAKYLIVGKNASNNFYAIGMRSAGTNGGNSSTAVSITENSGEIIITPSINAADETSPFEITIDGTTNAWTLFDAVSENLGFGGYLKPRGESSNGFRLTTEKVKWSITIATNGLATIIATDVTSYPNGRLRYNYNNSVFSCYLNSNPYAQSNDVYLYKAGIASTDPGLVVYNPIVNGNQASISYLIKNYPTGMIKYSVSGPTPSTNVFTSNNPIVLNGLADGDYSITMELVDGEHLSLNPAVIKGPFSFHVGAAQVEITPIYNIQYTTDPNGASPKVNETVTVEGIVTFIQKNFDTGNVEGYYIQDQPAPWCGIYVYNKTNPVEPGNTVRLTAKIDEYNNFTELTNVSDFQIIDISTVIPSPMVITCEEAGTEKYESCYVKICGFNVVKKESFGNYTINDISGSFTMNQSNQIKDKTITIANTYSAKGIVNYRDLFRLMPDDINDGNNCASSVNIDAFSNINVYPNPANDFIIVSTENKIDNLTIINVFGQIVLELSNVYNQQKISTNSLKSGLYLIKFTNNNQSKYEKLIIE